MDKLSAYESDSDIIDAMPIVADIDHSDDQITQITQSKGSNWNATIESISLDLNTFDNMENLFKSRKYSVNPVSLESNHTTYVGPSSQSISLQSISSQATPRATPQSTSMTSHSKSVEPQSPQASHKKRKIANDPSNSNYLGPWAGYHGESIGIPQGPSLLELRNAADLLPLTGKKIKAAMAAAGGSFSNDSQVEMDGDTVAKGHETSTLHSNLKDYLGRGYMHPPNYAKNDNCTLPKKVVFTYSGHKKGVNSVNFHPSGHLIITASMDSTVKLWDVHRDRSCLRTFSGHGKGVRVVSFNQSGSHFLSASYDRYIKLWDTETGNCISRWTPNQKTPYCLAWHPTNPLFLSGCSDKKIHQFDQRIPDTSVSEYTGHQSSVNSIACFGDKFVSSSDDKTLRVWEWGVPVAIKTVAESNMHAIPSVVVSPNRTYCPLFLLEFFN
jgi:pre-mRNA-processing factor 17